MAELRKLFRLDEPPELDSFTAGEPVNNENPDSEPDSPVTSAIKARLS